MNKKFHIVMEEDHMEKLYSSKTPFVKFVHNQRLDKMVSLLEHLKRNEKILDAGCGEGHLLEKIEKRFQSKFDLYGADITETAIKKAKLRVKTAKLFCKNILKLPFKNNFFDIVICSEVLEHIPDYLKAVDEIKRVTKKGGKIIITFPNELNWTLARFLLFRRPIKTPDHFNSFTADKMKKIFNLKLAKELNLPFNFPFSLSLTCICIFEKN